MTAAALVPLLSCRGGFHETSESCIGGCGAGSTCVTDYYATGGEYHACALSTEPDARCGHADPEADMQLCDGEHAVQCAGAYVTSEIDCASQGKVCVSFRGLRGPESACVVTKDPDTRCRADGSRRRVCEGGALVTCFGPYRSASVACREGAVCHEKDDDAACLPAGGPDPTCVARGGLSFCTGTVATSCFGDYEGSVFDCASVNRVCDDEAGFVVCR